MGGSQRCVQFDRVEIEARAWARSAQAWCRYQRCVVLSAHMPSMGRSSPTEGLHVSEARTESMAMPDAQDLQLSAARIRQTGYVVSFWDGISCSRQPCRYSRKPKVPW